MRLYADVGHGTNDVARVDEPLIEDGYFNVPQGLELGVDLDADNARAYLRQRSTFFE